MTHRFPCFMFTLLCCALAPARVHSESAVPVPEDVRDRVTAAGHWQVRVALRTPPLMDTAGTSVPPPSVLFSGGYFVGRGLELSAGGALGLPDFPSHEFFGRIAVYKRAPLVRVFLGGSVGYYDVGFSGRDFSYGEEGFRMTLDTGFQVAIPRAPGTRVLVEPLLALSYSLTNRFGDQRDIVDGQRWTYQMRVSLGLALMF
jgi:hypothetical protein